MRFLTTEPFTYNGVYYAAGVSSPVVMDFPDDARPSIKWYPMDEKALATVKLMSEKLTAIQGRPVPYHKIHNLAGAVLPDPVKIEKEEVADPDQPPPLPGLVAQTAVSQPSMSELQRGQRPSDKEPTKR